MNNNVILCIDASVQAASVALVDNDKLLGIKTCDQQKEHAAFIQPAIQDLCREHHLEMKELSAVAVTSGPGSYTGLRISMASAKGICYALNLPLLTLHTLEVMADAALKKINDPSGFLLCPLIDARRMEVFTAVYNHQLETVMEPQAFLLEENSFAELLAHQPLYFFGNGAEKWKTICKHPNARFVEVDWNAGSMMPIALRMFRQKKFASVAYAAPVYLKEFYNAPKK